VGIIHSVPRLLGERRDNAIAIALIPKRDTGPGQEIR